MSFIAVTDACVLYPASLRDTLLTAAELRLYQIQITDEILEEVRRNLAKDRMSEENAVRLVKNIKEAFSESIVTLHRSLIDDMPVNNKDRHVLAAAIASRADVIVTQNLKDFPASTLSQFEVEALSPDAFLLDLLNIDPEAMRAVLIKVASNLHRPAMTVAEVLNILKKHVPVFEARVQEAFPFSEHQIWIEEAHINMHKS